MSSPLVRHFFRLSRLSYVALIPRVTEAYRASKTLAERAAWSFVEKEKPGFDIATINPPSVTFKAGATSRFLTLFPSESHRLIFGPIIHDVPSPDKLNTSVNNWYLFLKGDKDADAATAGFGSLVDVRDVAQLHIDALVTEGAANQRFSVSHCALLPLKASRIYGL